MRYLLDENVAVELKLALRTHWPEITVWAVGDPGAPSRGTLDPDILDWCEANGFALVTNNRSSMPVHLTQHLAAGKHVPGIFILASVMTIGDTAEELALIWTASDAEEYADQIRFLPVSE
jgi:hypothetical protein